MGIAAERQLTPELMDAPDLDAASHDAALRGLRRLNRVSGAAGMVAGPIWRMARRRRMDGVSVLDVACGGGDVPVAVALRLRRARLGVDLMLTDRSAHALALAQAAAREAGVSVQVMAGEAPGRLPEGEWDFVTNSLFLHHLSRADVVGTLAAMAQRARVGVVVSDLRRSGVGLAVAHVMCRAVTRSRIVRFDGPVSVKAAWTCEEMREMAREAGLGGARVEACWPWRMLLVWERR